MKQKGGIFKAHWREGGFFCSLTLECYMWHLSKDCARRFLKKHLAARLLYLFNEHTGNGQMCWGFEGHLRRKTEQMSNKAFL